MLDSYFARMRNYGKFDGRTSRRDFWMYSLIFVGSLVLAAILDAMFGTETKAGGVFMGLVWIAHLAPNLAIAAERLHDQDRSAWWLLLLLTGFGGIVILIFAALPGTPNENRFGPVPIQSPSDLALDYAHQRSAPAKRENAAPANITHELERLAQMRANGSLSDDEFQMIKSRLLSRGT